jgi:hypothetical protein
MDLWLPPVMETPEVSESFKRLLRDTDPNLVIYWNPFKQRYMIDRVHRDSAGEHRHHVLTVEDPEGGFQNPGESHIQKIRALDAWSKFGGNDEAAMLRQRRERENAKAEYDARRQEEVKELWANAAKDDKAQLLKAYDLIKIHDMGRVH